MAKKRTILIPRIEDINITPDTSCMHPILEDNTLVCLHGGRVKLKAKKAKRIKSDNVPIMLDNEIQGASISGCVNPPILGGPCTKVAMVFPYTYSDHKVNNKHSVLQMGLIGVSNKGYPILTIPKKNKIKFALAKIQASPLAKIEYDRIRWEGVGKLKAAQRRRREKSKEKAKMLLYLENENKKDSKIKQISISNIPKKPHWRESEEDISKLYHDYEKQKSFLNSKEVPYGTKHSVRPDLYKNGSSIEIKNYNLDKTYSANNLINIITKQYQQRLQHLPPKTEQIFIIDSRGQNISKEIQEKIKQKIRIKLNCDILIQFKTK
ncbi:hypothetical protein V3K46_001757 [Campylobacter jejuni]|nr:hypothetical protein [Campylobacter jejuni]EJR1576209.1 hypothetical protein [Campylobacter jejuni]EKL1511495.1 hypothetical protein [Campylobacter jejuni]ELZ6576381.1 hypothetical protein [Campylobacter jejuni]